MPNLRKRLFRVLSTYSLMVFSQPSSFSLVHIYHSFSHVKARFDRAQLPRLEDMADDMQVDAGHTYGGARVSPYGPLPSSSSTPSAFVSPEPHSAPMAASSTTPDARDLYHL